jgi:hypothetical protein
MAASGRDVGADEELPMGAMPDDVMAELPAA